MAPILIKGTWRSSNPVFYQPPYITAANSPGSIGQPQAIYSHCDD